MTSKEYVIWLQGFVEACNDYSPTPKQWDTLKDKLAEVKDELTPSFPFGTPNTTPFIQPVWQEPHYTNPLDRYKITCTSGSAIAYGISTPPNYDPSTTTIWNPSGSNWSYTTTLQGVTGTNGPDDSKLNGIQTTISNQLELEFEPKNK